MFQDLIQIFTLFVSNRLLNHGHREIPVLGRIFCLARIKKLQFLFAKTCSLEIHQKILPLHRFPPPKKATHVGIRGSVFGASAVLHLKSTNRPRNISQLCMQYQSAQKRQLEQGNYGAVA